MFTIHNIRELMFQYTELLIRIAYGYVKDTHTAEDIVQEVFIKFYHQQENYEERGEVKAFLIKMTVNKSKDYLKSWTYKKILIKNKFFPPAGKRYADELVRKDEQTIVEDAIRTLPLTESKERVMKNVLQELENTSKRPKYKWRNVLLTPVLAISLIGIMFLVLNEILIENEQLTATEQQSPTEMHSELKKPTVFLKQGNLYMLGFTLGDSQERIIERLGEKYSMEQEDGSGADFVMDYDGVARFYFREDKLFQIVLMKVDKKYFDQLFADYKGFKFTSSNSNSNSNSNTDDDNRYIYSKETNQILKATTDVPDKDLHLYLKKAGPDLMENQDFLKMEQNLE